MFGIHKPSWLKKAGQYAAMVGAPVAYFANAPKDFLKTGGGLYNKLTGYKEPGNPDSYLDKITNLDKEYYDPYISQGNKAYEAFNPILNQMLSDPGSYLNNMKNQYQESPFYKLQQQEMLNTIGKAGAGGGYSINPSQYMSSSGLEASLMGPEMQDWLQNVMGVQKQGLGGEMGFYDTGYKASQAMASDLANVLGTKGSMAFRDARDRNKANQDLLSSLTQLVGLGAGALGNRSAGGYSEDSMPSRYSLFPTDSSPASRYSLYDSGSSPASRYSLY